MTSLVEAMHVVIASGPALLGSPLAAPAKLATGLVYGTIRGVTKEVVLDVTGPTAPIKDSWGQQRAAASATTKINRQDFGVKWNQTLDSGGVVISDEVSITMDIEMVLKPAPAPAK